MKLIDEKGKLFGIINAMDFFVIVLVIAIGAGTYYKFGIMDKTSATAATVPIEYTFEVKKVRDYMFNNVKEGDEIFDKTSGNSIGKIVEITSSPAKEVSSFADGTGINAEVQDRYDVVFKIEAAGTITSDGYFVNKTYELVAGSKKKIMTKYFEGEGSVKDILTEK